MGFVYNSKDVSGFHAMQCATSQYTDMTNNSTPGPRVMSADVWVIYSVVEFQGQ